MLTLSEVCESKSTPEAEESIAESKLRVDKTADAVKTLRVSAWLLLTVDGVIAMLDTELMALKSVVIGTGWPVITTG